MNDSAIIWNPLRVSASIVTATSTGGAGNNTFTHVNIDNGTAITTGYVQVVSEDNTYAQDIESTVNYKTPDWQSADMTRGYTPFTFCGRRLFLSINRMTALVNEQGVSDFISKIILSFGPFVRPLDFHDQYIRLKGVVNSYRTIIPKQNFENQYINDWASPLTYQIPSIKTGTLSAKERKAYTLDNEESAEFLNSIDKYKSDDVAYKLLRNYNRVHCVSKRLAGMEYKFQRHSLQQRVAADLQQLDSLMDPLNDAKAKMADEAVHFLIMQGFLTSYDADLPHFKSILISRIVANIRKATPDTPWEQGTIDLRLEIGRTWNSSGQTINYGQNILEYTDNYQEGFNTISSEVSNQIKISVGKSIQDLITYDYSSSTSITASAAYPYGAASHAETRITEAGLDKLKEIVDDLAVKKITTDRIVNIHTENETDFNNVKLHTLKSRDLTSSKNDQADAVAGMIASLKTHELIDSTKSPYKDDPAEADKLLMYELSTEDCL